MAVPVDGGRDIGVLGAKLAAINRRHDADQRWPSS
jgi:hypothetical protein